MYITYTLTTPLNNLNRILYQGDWVLLKHIAMSAIKNCTISRMWFKQEVGQSQISSKLKSAYNPRRNGGGGHVATNEIKKEQRKCFFWVGRQGATQERKENNDNLKKCSGAGMGVHGETNYTKQNIEQFWKKCPGRSPTLWCVRVHQNKTK